MKHSSDRPSHISEKFRSDERLLQLKGAVGSSAHHTEWLRKLREVLSLSK